MLIKILGSEWFESQDIKIIRRYEDHWYGIYKRDRIVIYDYKVSKTVAEFEDKTFNEVAVEINKQLKEYDN